MSQVSALEKIKQGTAQIIGEDLLVKKLAAGRTLKIKYGADPSSADLHLGHTVVLRKLRQLQDMGHTVQFLIGDFTARIGDPTGRNTTRPALTEEQVARNAQTYKEQVFRILDPGRTEVVYNSHWCGVMNFSQVIQLASRYTVARLLERDDFEKRLAAGKPIGLHELLYPLIQGYDSVVLKSDIELCGTDQIFNCLVARTLQEEAGIEPETIIAMPLLEGLDGVQKMSKSLGNSIGITEPPQDMFGKIMSLPDSLLEKYLELVAGYSAADLAEQKKRLQDPATNPRDLKLQLAMRLVAFFYNQPEAERVRSEFQRIFSDRSLPEDMPEYKLDPDLASAGISIMTLLMETKLVPSRSEAQRMIEQGAIKLNQNRIQDFKSNIRLNHGDVLQLGKRKFVKIVF